MVRCLCFCVMFVVFALCGLFGGMFCSAVFVLSVLLFGVVFLFGCMFVWLNVCLGLVVMSG